MDYLFLTLPSLLWGSVVRGVGMGNGEWGMEIDGVGTMVDGGGGHRLL